MLANDDLFVLPNFHLRLWWNSIVAATARIAINGDYSKSVAVRAADAVIGLQ